MPIVEKFSYRNKVVSLILLETAVLLCPPTSKQLTGHIGIGLCVRPSVRPFKTHAC